MTARLPRPLVDALVSAGAAAALVYVDAAAAALSPSCSGCASAGVAVAVVRPGDDLRTELCGGAVARALSTRAAAALLAAMWARLRAAARLGSLAVAAALGAAPALAPRLAHARRGRRAARRTSSRSRLSVAFLAGTASGTRLPRLLRRAGCPSSPAPSGHARRAATLAVFGFAAAAGLALAYRRRPAAALAALLVGAGWPATLVAGERNLLRGALILAAPSSCWRALRPAVALVAARAGTLVCRGGVASTSAARRAGRLLAWQTWDSRSATRTAVTVGSSGTRATTDSSSETPTTVFTSTGPAQALYWRGDDARHLTSGTAGSKDAAPSRDPLERRAGAGAAARSADWLSHVDDRGARGTRTWGGGSRCASPARHHGRTGGARPAALHRASATASGAHRRPHAAAARCARHGGIDGGVPSSPASAGVRVRPHAVPARHRASPGRKPVCRGRRDRVVVCAAAGSPTTSIRRSPACRRSSGRVTETPVATASTSPARWRSCCATSASPRASRPGSRAGVHERPVDAHDHDAHAWVEVWFRGLRLAPLRSNAGPREPRRRAYRPRPRASTLARRRRCVGRTAAFGACTNEALIQLERAGSELGGGAGRAPRTTAGRCWSSAARLLALVGRRGRARGAKAVRRRRLPAPTIRARLRPRVARELAEIMLDQRVDVPSRRDPAPSSASVRSSSERRGRGLRLRGRGGRPRSRPPPRPREDAARARAEARELRRVLRRALSVFERLRGALSLRSLRSARARS